ncbi:MAG: helix-turn-helix domain-containing protein [Planctomycetota bacterium]|nr:helix-turn-helix domain-containing protein [Planctomycetota bacterium]
MPRKKTALNREEVVRQFGRKVRELRLARGLSQRTLAQKAGFSFSYATRLERGDAEPGLELVVRIAQALGATPHELIQAAPTDPWPELAAQARQRLNAILERQDRDALAVILPVLALAEDASARRRK